MENSQLNTKALTKLYFGETQKNLRRIGADLTPSARYLAQTARSILSEHPKHLATAIELDEFVKSLEKSEGEQLTERERAEVVSLLTISYEDFGPLGILIDDESVNDIIIARYDDVSIQRGRRNYQTGLSFGDPQNYKAFVETLLKRAGKACTVATPVIDASLGENIRLCVTHESISPNGFGPCLTIRIARHSAISLSALISFGLAPKSVLSYLGSLVSSGECTVLIAGEVGTGKTTLVRALAAEMPEEEAVLVIEDTEEIKLNRSFSRTLLTREANTEGAGRISPSLAIRAGMRMAMNRIILGEMRDAEAAEAFIDVCSSGHSGISTIHARSTRDALNRLELFLSRAEPGVGIETIRRQISNAISAVAYLGVDPETQERRVFEISEIGPSSDGQIQLSPIFSFIKKDIPSWQRMSGVTNFSVALNRDNLTLPPLGRILTLETEDK